MAVALAVGLWCADAEEPSRDVPALRQILDLSEREIGALTNGEVITRVEATEGTEVMGAAAVRVQTTADRLITGFRRVTGFTQSQLVRTAAVISPMPSARDFAALTLAPSEVRELRDCRVGNCAMKLSAGDIARFRKEVKWDSGATHGQVEALLRDVLAGEATRYLRGGDAMLTPLADKEEPLNRAAEFEAIFSRSQTLESVVPGFSRRLSNPPATNGEGDADFVYWSSIDIGLKPVISITHVQVQRPGPAGVDVVIASKQIYANHYFDASLSVTALVRPAPTSPGYLLYVNRSRVDLFKGWFGGFTRSIVRRRVRDGLQKNMRLAREHLEKP